MERFKKTSINFFKIVQRFFSIRFRLLGRPPGFFSGFSVPDFKEAVPGSCAYGHAILGDAKAADAIVMASENT